MKTDPLPAATALIKRLQREFTDELAVEREPYSLFCTDGSSEADAKMPDLDRLIPVYFNSLSAAVAAACKLIGAGATVWQIARATGFMMERGDIEGEYSRRCDDKSGRSLKTRRAGSGPRHSISIQRSNLL